MQQNLDIRINFEFHNNIEVIPIYATTNKDGVTRHYSLLENIADLEGHHNSIMSMSKKVTALWIDAYKKKTLIELLSTFYSKDDLFNDIQDYPIVFYNMSDSDVKICRKLNIHNSIHNIIGEKVDLKGEEDEVVKNGIYQVNMLENEITFIEKNNDFLNLKFSHFNVNDKMMKKVSLFTKLKKLKFPINNLNCFQMIMSKKSFTPFKQGVDSIKKTFNMTEDEITSLKITYAKDSIYVF